MSEPVLLVSDLVKRYKDVVALGGVSLDVQPGEVVALLGPNGAGKTTLVSIICGLRRADSGSVIVKGVDALGHPAQARRHIGLAPQELGVYPIDTVRQNLALFAELAGVRRRHVRSEIEALAVALRLDELMDRKAGELSGGQKRRLHTALALVNRPSLILLDEATVGADVGTRAALVEVVRRLAADGSGVLYSTHYLHEVEELDARVVIIDRGAVIARGSVAELVRAHAASYVELGFDEMPPVTSLGSGADIDGDVVRFEVVDAATDMPRVLGELGEHLAGLRTIDVINPSLESVFLQLTGRRYDPGEEVADVVVA
jgi:ABC-2 type transport system ATP-binding protein